MEAGIFYRGPYMQVVMKLGLIEDKLNWVLRE